MKAEPNEKWMQGLKRRMEECSEPLPDELWTRIERDWTAARKPRGVVLLRWGVAAAVLALLLASVSVWMWRTDGRTMDSATEVAVLTSPQPSPDSDLPGEQPDVAVQTHAAAEPVRLARRTETSALPAEKAEEVVPDEKAETAEAESPTGQTAETKRPEVRSDRKTDDLPARRNWTADARVQVKPTRWSVGLAYGGDFRQENGRFPGYGTLNQSGSAALASWSANSLEGVVENNALCAPLRTLLMNNVGKTTETRVVHKHPFTVGLSFCYDLPRRFSVETGLDYTLLSSELTSGSRQDYYVESYKLHYLGIPLKFNWTFWQNKRVACYVSAGGELEKSVAGHFQKTFVESTEPVQRWNKTVKPLQASVLGHAGVQLNLGKHFGLYVEPGLVYYFDDGGDLQTIRKEKPLNFKLRMGLRWTHFGKK